MRERRQDGPRWDESSNGKRHKSDHGGGNNEEFGGGGWNKGWNPDWKNGWNDNKGPWNSDDRDDRPDRRKLYEIRNSRGEFAGLDFTRDENGNSGSTGTPLFDKMRKAVTEGGLEVDRQDLLVFAKTDPKGDSFVDSTGKFISNEEFAQRLNTYLAQYGERDGGRVILCAERADNITQTIIDASRKNLTSEQRLVKNGVASEVSRKLAQLGLTTEVCTVSAADTFLTSQGLKCRVIDNHGNDIKVSENKPIKTVPGLAAEHYRGGAILAPNATRHGYAFSSYKQPVQFHDQAWSTKIDGKSTAIAPWSTYFLDDQNRVTGMCYRGADPAKLREQAIPDAFNVAMPVVVGQTKNPETGKRNDRDARFCVGNRALDTKDVAKEIVRGLNAENDQHLEPEILVNLAGYPALNLSKRAHPLNKLPQDLANEMAALLKKQYGLSTTVRIRVPGEHTGEDSWNTVSDVYFTSQGKSLRSQIFAGESRKSQERRREAKELVESATNENLAVLESNPDLAAKAANNGAIEVRDGKNIKALFFGEQQTPISHFEKSPPPETELAARRYRNEVQRALKPEADQILAAFKKQGSDNPDLPDFPIVVFATEPPKPSPKFEQRKAAHYFPLGNASHLGVDHIGAAAMAKVLAERIGNDDYPNDKLSKICIVLTKLPGQENPLIDSTLTPEQELFLTHLANETARGIKRQTGKPTSVILRIKPNPSTVDGELPPPSEWTSITGRTGIFQRRRNGENNGSSSSKTGDGDQSANQPDDYQSGGGPDSGSGPSQNSDSDWPPDFGENTGRNRRRRGGPGERRRRGEADQSGPDGQDRGNSPPNFDDNAPPDDRAQPNNQRAGRRSQRRPGPDQPRPRRGQDSSDRGHERTKPGTAPDRNRWWSNRPKERKGSRPEAERATDQKQKKVVLVDPKSAIRKDVEGMLTEGGTIIRWIGRVPSAFIGANWKGPADSFVGPERDMAEHADAGSSPAADAAPTQGPRWLSDNQASDLSALTDRADAPYPVIAHSADGEADTYTFPSYQGLGRVKANEAVEILEKDPAYDSTRPVMVMSENGARADLARGLISDFKESPTSRFAQEMRKHGMDNPVYDMPGRRYSELQEQNARTANRTGLDGESESWLDGLITAVVGFLTGLIGMVTDVLVFTPDEPNGRDVDERDSRHWNDLDERRRRREERETRDGPEPLSA